jgi:hypothetical protein
MTLLLGRYFAGSSVTIAAMVYGKREQEDSVAAERGFDYWITDGVYGRACPFPFQLVG